MTGGEGLRDALRRAAGDGRAAGRAEAYGTPQDGAALILAHLDSAVLARRFRIEAGGAVLTCEVAARRLTGLGQAGPAGPSGAPAGGLAEPGDAAAVAALLTGFCAGARSLRVLPGPPAGPSDPSVPGLPLAALAAALGLPQDPPEPGDPFDALLAVLAETVLAAVLLDEEGTLALAGDAAAAGALAELAAGLLDRILVPGFPLLATFETDAALVFAVPDAATHLLLVGRRGRFLAVQLRGANGAQTLDRWRALRGFATSARPL